MINYSEKVRLDGKKAVVTGGAGLIGREVVYALSQAGATAVIADINEGQAKEIIVSGEKDSCDIRYIKFDITDIACLERNIQNITETLGSLDIWVNSAYPRTDDFGAKVEDISIESWRKNVDMQLNSYALSAKYAAGHMKESGGSIVNLSSIYGIVGADFSIYEGTGVKPVNMIYSAVKGGIVSMVRYLASYYGHLNIRVNAVCPGGVYDSQDKVFVENYSNKVPLKRMASPEEIASAVLFLASPASSYVTGETLMVDGGWTAL